jgi:phenylacetate-coenzyme A ligase PaaK-like adenylate-forming protein
MKKKQLIHSIFSLSGNSKTFEEYCLEVFNFQFENNAVYRKFCQLTGVTDPKKITGLDSIPFLPIQFFKSHTVLSDDAAAEEIFTSSGTTGSSPSKHFVTDRSVYESSFRQTFQEFYGDIKDYVVLALLPSYLERKGSSLIYMAQDFITQSKHPESGFYLNELDDLSAKLQQLDNSSKKVLLLGVSFALLDLIEHKNFQLNNTFVMETGGMKGRRKEMIREELHAHLKKGFGVDKIHSEYGMTEMLSQAYSQGEGIFKCPPLLGVQIRDTENPFQTLKYGKSGGLNIIDLANINSCSFIATQDLAGKTGQNKFQVLGRFDQSDLRGCNLLLLEN